MENHPIPQDVTGFQFKLIGDMTIKQFAFLGGGCLLGWFFYAVLPIPVLLKLLIGFLIAGFGAALAFLPLEGRPMDVMATNFVKALFAPTLFMYQKNGGTLSFSTIQVAKVPTASAKPKATTAGPNQVHDSSMRLQQYLNSLPHTPKNALDQKEMVFFQSIQGLTGPTTQAPTTPGMNVAYSQPQPAQQVPIVAPPQPLAPPEEPKKEVQQPKAEEPVKMEETLQKEAALLQQELDVAKKEEAQAKVEHPQQPVSHEKVDELETQLQQIMAQKQQLEGQLLRLQQQMQAKKDQPAAYTPSPKEPLVEAEAPKIQNVHTIPKGMESKAGIPKPPDSPNIIMGILKDPRGNVLPNILVEVKDSDGNPVRAFKTNQLGQFASATPLLNGTYTISFEDSSGKSKFDTIELEAGGEILQPLEVISSDPREDLRKSLFG